MDIASALEFISARQHGVLTTQRADGRPQLSNVAYHVADDRSIRISVTDTRAKTRNVRRDPRASLHVTSDDFWAYAVVDCDVTLMQVATDENDATADALVDYYRALQGEHPDWSDYRRAMVADQRLLLLLTPTHAYGMLGA